MILMSLSVEARWNHRTDHRLHHLMNSGTGLHSTCFLYQIDVISSVIKICLERFSGKNHQAPIPG
jgi:hypothetical protein